MSFLIINAGILVGHNHDSYVGDWRGFKVICGAGSGFALCTYKRKRNCLEVQMYDNNLL